MMEGMEVLRGAHKNAENKLPQSMKHFPPYASGCFTIISADLAHLLAKPPIVPIKMVNGACLCHIRHYPECHPKTDPPISSTWPDRRRIFWDFIFPVSGGESERETDSSMGGRCDLSEPKPQTSAHTSSRGPTQVDRCTPAEAIVGIHYVPPTCFPKLSHNVSQGFPICNSKVGCA